VDFLSFPGQILNNLHILWSFVLLVVRYGALLSVLPGVGLGEKGLIVRVPASMVMAFASLNPENYAAMPAHWGIVAGGIVSEVLFGAVLGLIPLLIVSGVQTGATIASTTMGLSASNLIDPTSGVQVPDLARVYGDFTVVLFLAFGGHYMVLHAASGLGGTFAPGSLFMAEDTIRLLTEKSGDVFRLGTMVSAPVVVALLLTQFVMGLLSRAVPTVNIFIVSFPLTIGIGLLLSVLVMPELEAFIKRELVGLETTLMQVVEDRSVR
jgi:flagellar biosynthesis protein FliR